MHALVVPDSVETVNGINVLRGRIGSMGRNVCGFEAELAMSRRIGGMPSAERILAGSKPGYKDQSVK
jgi:hypothetical protein